MVTMDEAQRKAILDAARRNVADVKAGKSLPPSPSAPKRDPLTVLHAHAAERDRVHRAAREREAQAVEAEYGETDAEAADRWWSEIDQLIARRVQERVDDNETLDRRIRERFEEHVSELHRHFEDIVATARKAVEKIAATDEANALKLKAELEQVRADLNRVAGLLEASNRSQPIDMPSPLSARRDLN
jgi:hypothetical protein